jgi:hypothetical protein
VQVAGRLQQARRVEPGDRRVHLGAVAAIVGVQPAEHELAAFDQVDVGLPASAEQLGWVGQRRPHSLHRARDPAAEPQHDVLAAGCLQDPSASGCLSCVMTGLPFRCALRRASCRASYRVPLPGPLPGPLPACRDGVRTRPAGRPRAAGKAAARRRSRRVPLAAARTIAAAHRGGPGPARLSQHSQVPGGSWLGEAEQAGQLAGRPRVLKQQVQDAAPVRFGDHLERGGHGSNIVLCLYTR